MMTNAFDEFDQPLANAFDEFGGPDITKIKLAKEQNPVTWSGLTAEALKGLGRGAASLPDLLNSFSANFPQGANPNPHRVIPSMASYLPARPANPQEQMAGTGAEIAGSMLPFAFTGPGNVAQKIAQMAVPAAGGAIGQQMGGPAGQLIGTIAGPIAGAGIGRALNPQTNPDVRELMKLGVTPTPGGVLGGVVKKLEALPFLKDLTGHGTKNAISSFNTAIINRALAPIGKKVEGAGFEAFAAADDAASNVYQNLLPKMKMQVDSTFVADMKQLKSLANGMQPEQRSTFLNTLNTEISGRFTPAGLMHPENMQQADSELGRLARGYSNDPAFANKELGNAFRQAQSNLRDLIVRNNPKYATELTNANKAFSNLLRVEHAVVNSGDANGVFTPEGFMGSVKAFAPGIRKGSFARSEAPMQDIARMGQRVLGKVPSGPWAEAKAAGTVAGLAGAGGSLFGLPGILAALGVAGSYTNPGQKAMLALLARRPDLVRNMGVPFSGPPSYGLIPATMLPFGQQQPE